MEVPVVVVMETEIDGALNSGYKKTKQTNRQSGQHEPIGQKVETPTATYMFSQLLNETTSTISWAGDNKYPASLFRLAIAFQGPETTGSLSWKQLILPDRLWTE